MDSILPNQAGDFENTGGEIGLAPKTRVDVEIRASWSSKLGTVVFGLGGTVDPSTNGDIKGSTIRIGKGKSPTEIRFKLKDDTQRDLEFVESDPIWVGLKKDCEAGGCPSSGLSGFQVVRVSERKLTVSRADIDDEYVYMLRFIDETGKSFEYDPIIKNRL